MRQRQGRARCVSGRAGHGGWHVDQLRRLGLGRCVLQAGGEPAQRGYAKDISEAAARSSASGIAAAHTPPHDHQAEGGVEKAVRDVKDQIRIMLCALARRVGPIPVSGTVIEWLTAWAAELLMGACVGQDGLTSFRRLRGRP